MGKAGTAWTLELGKAEQLVLGSAREDTAVHAASRQDANATSRLLQLHLRRMAGAREVNIGPAPLVVVVEPRNVRLHAVHRRHLEGEVDVGMPTLISVSLKPPPL